MRLTVAAVKNSRIPVQINIRATDTRFIQVLNSAVERLLARGHFLGTTGRYTLSVNNRIVTLPPSLASIEKVALNTIPMPIRSGLWEFNGQGYGVRTDADFIWEALRIPGLYPTSRDVDPGCNLKVFCDFATDAGKSFIAFGKDDSDNEIRTTQSGAYAGGEVIALSQAGTLSTKKFNSISGVQLPTNLDGCVWAYQVDGSGTQTLLSKYEAFESAPGYTRYRINAIGETDQTVEVIGRLAYVPVKNDTDFCLVSSLAALQYAMDSVIACEQHDHAREAALMALAVKELDLQVAQYSEAEQPSLEIVGPNLASADPIHSLL